MTSKLYAHDLDLANIAQLVGARMQNLSTTAMNALAEQLTSDNEGLFIYNTNTKRIFTWNGTKFDPYQVDVVGDIKFAGVINAGNAGTVDRTPGYQYVVDADGTLSAAGVTFSPSAKVEAGDQVLFTSETQAFVVQRNDIEATTTASGNVRLATQAEVNAGMDADAAVTSATLHGYVDPQFAADRARLADVESKNAEQDGRLTSVENRATEIEAKNVEQDGRLTSVEGRATAIEAKNVEQDGRLDAVEFKNLEQDGRLTSVEGRVTATEEKNLEQDGRLTSVEGRVTATEQKNVEQDGRLTAVEQKNTEQDARILATEQKNTEQDGRLTSVEARVTATEEKNLEQDGRLTAVEAKNTEQDGRLTAVESKNTEQDSRLASLEGDRVKSFFATVNLAANVPLTVMHGLTLSNKDAFVARTALGGSDISLDVDSVNTNSITLTSLIPLTNVAVYVTGH